LCNQFEYFYAPIKHTGALSANRLFVVLSVRLSVTSQYPVETNAHGIMRTMRFSPYGNASSLFLAPENPLARVSIQTGRVRNGDFRPVNPCSIGVNSYWAAGPDPPRFGPRRSPIVEPLTFCAAVFALFITTPVRKNSSVHTNL